LFTARRLNGFGLTGTISTVLPKGETHLAHSPGHAPSPPFQVVRLENRLLSAWEVQLIETIKNNIFF